MPRIPAEPIQWPADKHVKAAAFCVSHNSSKAACGPSRRSRLRRRIPPSPSRAPGRSADLGELVLGGLPERGYAGVDRRPSEGRAHSGRLAPQRHSGRWRAIQWWSHDPPVTRWFGPGSPVASPCDAGPSLVADALLLQPGVNGPVRSARFREHRLSLLSPPSTLRPVPDRSRTSRASGAWALSHIYALCRACKSSADFCARPMRLGSDESDVTSTTRS